MKLDLPLSLRLKGQRDYVQSADIYDAAVAALSGTFAPGELSRLHFVFRTFTGRELKLTSELPAPEERIATFSFEAGGEKHKLGLVPRGGDIRERVEYDEEAVFARCTLDDEARSMTYSHGDDVTASLTEVIVAATKLMHQRLFPAEGKWIVTQMDSDVALFELPFSQVVVTLVRNLGEHLTKSEVAIDGRKLGLIFFSLI